MDSLHFILSWWRPMSVLSNEGEKESKQIQSEAIINQVESLQ